MQYNAVHLHTLPAVGLGVGAVTRVRTKWKKVNNQRKVENDINNDNQFKICDMRV